MEEFVLYRCKRYEVRLLEERHGKEIFRFLSKGILPKREKVTGEEYSAARHDLKATIRYALGQEKYNPVGLYEEGRLIGVSFSSIVKGENPWLGYLYMEPEKRNGRGYIVLMNYLLNELYYGFDVECNVNIDARYAKNVYTSMLGKGALRIQEEVYSRIGSLAERLECEKVYKWVS